LQVAVTRGFVMKSVKSGAAIHGAAVLINVFINALLAGAQNKTKALCLQFSIATPQDMPESSRNVLS